jgi:hypothetical protein
MRCVPQKSNVLFCVLLYTKGHNAKDIHKEVFPVYVGKCLSRKVIRSLVAVVSLRHDAKKGRQHHDSDRCAAVFIISFVSTVLLSLRHVADIVS